MWKKSHKISQVNTNGRINIIFAVIFLLGASIIYKLYGLQVRDYDLYAARAQSQQQISKVLEPKRGTIFIQAGKEEGDKLYPIATNKEFAFLYAVPKDVMEPAKFGEALYNFFKKSQVEKEVDNIFKKEDEERLKKEIDFVENTAKPEEKEALLAKVQADNAAHLRDPQFLELRSLKREEEISKRQSEIVKDYLAKLTKANDPYEPLEPKVDEETLKNIYLTLLPITKPENVFGSAGAKFSNREADQLLEGANQDRLKIRGNNMILETSDGAERVVYLDGLGFFMKTHRFYPEKNIGANILGFTKVNDENQVGEYGLEGFFDEELKGLPGKMKVDTGAAGNLIVVDGREYTKAQDGNDLVLTIDRTIQFYVCQKLNEAIASHQADGGSVILMDPKTGAIWSMCSAPDYDPNNYKDVKNIRAYTNQTIFDQYEPGSVMKTITLASAIDQEKITPDTTYEDKGFLMIEGWKKPIRNSDYETHGGHGITDMNTVLDLSLNTGAIFAMRSIGRYKFAEYIQNFGFGEKIGIEMDTEVAGDISKILGDKVHEIYAATASFGQGVAVTPLQMISSYAALANGGILMKPYIVKEIIHPDGTKQEIEPQEIRRVVSKRTADLMGGMLVNVTEKGHSKRSAVPGYWVGVKTGTAQAVVSGQKGYGSGTIHTALGYAPVDNPKFVMLVKIDRPKDAQYAEGSSVPLFGEIAKFLLGYWEIPKTR